MISPRHQPKRFISDLFIACFFALHPVFFVRMCCHAKFYGCKWFFFFALLGLQDSFFMLTRICPASSTKGKDGMSKCTWSCECPFFSRLMSCCFRFRVSAAFFFIPLTVLFFFVVFVVCIYSQVCCNQDGNQVCTIYLFLFFPMMRFFFANFCVG